MTTTSACAATAVLILAGLASAQEHVSFPTQDGWIIHGDLYGTGDRAIVLAHGGRFEKGSWQKQALVLVKAGFRALAIDLRGADFGSPLDVLAAVRYLRVKGAKSVSVVGASMGGDAAADAVAAAPGEIDRLVLLGSGAYGQPEKWKVRKLFIIARDDANDAGPRLPKIRAQYEKAPDPKELIVVDGSAHAQFLFQTDQAERVMREILRFLSAP
jgi:pimeloyl-ACP methyl ester carboxylesterase